MEVVQRRPAIPADGLDRRGYLSLALGARSPRTLITLGSCELGLDFSVDGRAPRLLGAQLGNASRAPSGLFLGPEPSFAHDRLQTGPSTVAGSTLSFRVTLGSAMHPSAR
ncbi:hypothetical protein [Cellulomonas humilata]|uniref:hypothetical protein n=1 Tax=Cellulomonas humilata TaxID=144055 RepID=UPI001FEAF3DE|nr:hypothetical protein [Cellulomonas humilata]